jgi:CRISPR-associated exonuclease Cas4
MCLEEMHALKITNGSIYYGETRHRIEVQFTLELRARVKELAARMHKLFDGGITPLPSGEKALPNVFLVEICLPDCTNSFQHVSDYLKWELDMD